MPSLDPKIDELIDWSRHREADEEDPRALGAGPRRGKHVPDRKWRRNKFAIWIDCARCALRLETAPMKSAPASHHKKVKVEIVETALKLIEERNLNDDDISATVMRGIIQEVEGNQKAKNALARFEKQKTRMKEAEASTSKPTSSSSAARPSTAPSARPTAKPATPSSPSRSAASWATVNEAADEDGMSEKVMIAWQGLLVGLVLKEQRAQRDWMED